MTNVKLDRNTIIQLGNTVLEILTKANIKNDSILRITVDKESFKKIDEDLYYRGDDKNNKFQPSENEIIVKFLNFIIIIEKET